jgi:hypothetical protein
MGCSAGLELTSSQRDNGSVRYVMCNISRFGSKLILVSWDVKTRNVIARGVPYTLYWAQTWFGGNDISQTWMMVKDVYASGEFYILQLAIQLKVLCVCVIRVSKCSCTLWRQCLVAGRSLWFVEVKVQLDIWKLVIRIWFDVIVFMINWAVTVLTVNVSCSVYSQCL